MLKTLKWTGAIGLLVVAFGVAGCANMRQTASTVAKPAGNAAEALRTLGTFKTFLEAAQAAGVTDLLTGEQPVTVFAPTDNAFARLPPGTMRQLMAPANRDRLRAVVLSHIVSDRMTTDFFLNGVRDVRTAAGTNVEVNALDPDKGIFYGRARMVKPNIEATNGVVHAVDQVVLP